MKNSNLLQEFGNVTNVFSDKTGTLTKNEMNLVSFSVDGHIYTVSTPTLTLTLTLTLTRTLCGHT